MTRCRRNLVLPLDANAAERWFVEQDVPDVEITEDVSSIVGADDIDLVVEVASKKLESAPEPIILINGHLCSPCPHKERSPDAKFLTCEIQ